ncbi:hypothetical protein NDU88_006092 [Pleurodeles waltl]|uniref:t-SNARE coiled-coil homology domain-containing protein n=1 Tax=Pleurodeles waltl TaxID=8319 RepID=A0AAV7SNR5_PLEWA|nr:hypothetical protein NDU88_006092 [Pleurodeles waltl]
MFYTIESRLERMKDRMDKQDTRIQGAKDRISNLDDGANNMEKGLEQIENRLRMVATKNEDLEARGRRNNICIMGIVESTDTGRLDTFVEILLTNTC